MKTVAQALGLLLFSAPLLAAAVDSASAPPTSPRPTRSVVCTVIREEPGAPTLRFELRRQTNNQYTARYLQLPGDETQPPTVAAAIENLDCRFLARDRRLFRCQKLGASVTGFRIVETELSPISNGPLSRTSYEFRAVGNEVPGVFLAYRFMVNSECVVR